MVGVQNAPDGVSQCERKHQHRQSEDHAGRDGIWHQPRWNEVWFPDAFAGPMAQLLVALEQGAEPEISGRDNLGTMALVDAAYRSAHERRAVAITEITGA